MNMSARNGGESDLCSTSSRAYSTAIQQSAPQQLTTSQAIFTEPVQLSASHHVERRILVSRSIFTAILLSLTHTSPPNSIWISLAIAAILIFLAMSEFYILVPVSVKALMVALISPCCADSSAKTASYPSCESGIAIFASRHSTSISNDPMGIASLCRNGTK